MPTRSITTDEERKKLKLVRYAVDRLADTSARHKSLQKAVTSSQGAVDVWGGKVIEVGGDLMDGLKSVGMDGFLGGKRPYDSALELDENGKIIAIHTDAEAAVSRMPAEEEPE